MMKVNTVSVRLPYPSISIRKLFRKFHHVLYSTIEPMKQYAEMGVHKTSSNAKSHLSQVKKPRFSFPKKVSKKFVIYGLLILIAVFIGSRIIGSSTPESNRIEVSEAKAGQEIAREFSFPLRDEEGEVVSDIKYTIEDAELRDEIVIRGQVATSVQGRLFLIVSLRIRNDHEQAIEINTKDYVRLVVNGDETEQLAPNIHNDPLQIQAISTEPTRLGFTIDEEFDSLELRVGEIEGDKESIPLDLN